MDALFRNISYAVRTLTRTPTFTATVVLTLALGMGANSAVFSAIDTVLLRPLPFPDGDRLVLITHKREGSGATGVAPTRVEDWQRLNSTFDAIAGYYVDEATVTLGGVTERIRRGMVSPRFFEVLGASAAVGRTFTEEEYRFGGPIAVLLSDRYWRATGADPGAVGRTVNVGNASISTVGVMPSSFQFPERALDVWAPITDAPWTQPRTLTWYTVTVGCGTA
jgi:putative ABC transport system permease protein